MIALGTAHHVVAVGQPENIHGLRVGMYPEPLPELAEVMADGGLAQTHRVGGGRV